MPLIIGGAIMPAVGGAIIPMPLIIGGAIIPMPLDGSWNLVRTNERHHCDHSKTSVGKLFCTLNGFLCFRHALRETNRVPKTRCDHGVDLSWNTTTHYVRLSKFGVKFEESNSCNHLSFATIGNRSPCSHRIIAERSERVSRVINVSWKINTSGID